jgi:hypothetical protein
MPRVQNINKRSSAPRKILHMALPDAETLAFWKMTADDAREYAARIAKFSRVVGKNAGRNPVRPSERRWRALATAVQSRRSEALGSVLMMPSRSDLSSRSFSRKLKSSQGGDMKAAPGVAAKKVGKKLKHGRALQIMCYPRLRTKGILVQASRDAGLALSSFILLSAIEKAAKLRGCGISDLIPADELQRYRTYRVGPKRGAAKQHTRFEK